MRHYIIISHAYFSKGLVSSIEMIIGKNENVSYYCAYIDNESEYSKEKIVKKINTFSKNDEVVILLGH